LNTNFIAWITWSKTRKPCGK